MFFLVYLRQKKCLNSVKTYQKDILLLNNIGQFGQLLAILAQRLLDYTGIRFKYLTLGE